MIRFQCHTCATDLHVADSRGGTWVYCPRCNERLTVPALVAIQRFRPTFTSCVASIRSPACNSVNKLRDSASVFEMA